MNKFIFVLLTYSFLLSCSFNTNCLNKGSFLSGFDKFVEDVHDYHDSFSKEEWRPIDSEFEDYLKTCYPKFKESMSAGEKLDFWKDAFSYGLYRSANDDSYEFDLEELGVDMEEELESLSQVGRAELERFIKEDIGPEIENALDEVLKEMENLGDKLKEWLDGL